MKRIIPILSVSLALAVIAALAAPTLVSPARLRAEAVAALREATGVEPSISGDPSLSLLPWPSVRLPGVSLSADESVRLKIRDVRVVLDLLPLLTGRFVASRIDLVEPDLVLSQWGQAVAPIARVPALPATGRSYFRIVDGTVRLDREGVLIPVVEKIEGSLVWRGGRDLAADGRFVWRDQPLDFNVELNDIAALGRGEASGLLLTISGEPIDTAFEGDVTLGATPTAEGNFRVSTPNLRKSLEWIGYAAPTQDGFGPFALRAKAQVGSGGAALTELRADLDGNRSEGGLAVKLERGRAVLQGTLASDTIDLSPYGKLALSEPDGRAWNRQPIQLGPLASLDADLRFSAARARVGDTTVAQVAASAVLKGGRLTLAIGDAEAWGGAFQASATLVQPAGAAGADVRVQLAGTDVALGPALGDLFRVSRLEGTGAFEIALGGAGTSVADIVEHLGGSVSVNAEKGAVLGVDVPRVLGRLERRPLSGGGAIRGGRTDFETLDAQATIAGGVAKVDLLTLDSPLVRIDVTGLVSIAERDLDLQGTASLVRAPATAGTPALAGFDLPFVVQGSWDSPFLLPDPQALIRRSGAARPLLGAAREPNGPAAAVVPLATGVKGTAPPASAPVQ